MRRTINSQSVGLVKAVTDRALLGGAFKPWDRQRELLAGVEEHVLSVWCIGRRSSKSFCGGLALTWGATLRPELREYVLPDERVFHVAIAANQTQAKVVLDSARRAVHGSRLLAPLVEREDRDAIHFRNGNTVAAFVCSARTTRGFPIASLDLDEFAWFQTTEEGPQAAATVYTATTPSLSQFGEHRRLIISSTPNGEGEFKRQFDNALAAQDAGESVIVFQFPTWEVNPTLDQGVYAEARRALGPQFEAEYGASFLASGSALLSDADIRACIVSAGDLDPSEGRDWVCGADFAFRRDRSAAVIVGRDLSDPRLLRVGAIRTWDPPTDKSEGTEGHRELVLSEAASLARHYGATIYADTYESDTIRGKLRRFGAFAQTIATGAGVKGTLYRELAEKVKLGEIQYPDHPLLIGELRRLKASYQGRFMTVENPRREGGHGDVAASLAMAVYRMRQEGATGGQPLRPGTASRPLTADVMALDRPPHLRERPVNPRGQMGHAPNRGGWYGRQF